MDHQAQLLLLVERLYGEPVLSAKEADRLHRETLENAMSGMLRGETYGEATGGLAILNQDEQAFRSELKSIDNDLGRQIEIVGEALDGWFRKGITPPPYYPWRIAVILSKEKRKVEEAEFLRAWCRHFGSWKGSRYEALAKRARKLGALE